MNAFDVLCAQMTRDLFAIAKFLFDTSLHSAPLLGGGSRRNIAIPFNVGKLGWWGYRRCKNVVSIYNRLVSIPACDRRTSCDGIVCAMHTRRAEKNASTLSRN